MIESISFRGYKAFDEGELKLKPISLLIGANSVGKSSILQLLLMLQQTAIVDREYNSPLKLYGGGGALNLGEIENLFRRKNLKNELSFTINIKDTDLKLFINEQFSQSFLHEVFQRILLPYQMIEEDSKHSNKHSIHNSLIQHLLSTRNTSPKEQVINAIETMPKRIKHSNKSNLKKLNDIFGDNQDLNLEKHTSEYLYTTDMVYSLSDFIKSELFSFTFDFSFNETKSSLIKSRILIRNDNKDIINFTFNKNGDLDNVEFPFFRTKYQFDFKKIVSGLVRGDKSIFSQIVESFEKFRMPKNSSIFQKYFSILLNKFILSLKKPFSNNSLNYIGPLRAHPRRYYFLDKAKVNLALDALDGDTLTEILKEDKDLIEKANNWFRKFNIEIGTQPLKDAIHRLTVRQSSLELNITDVGFGISQVLPVVVQGFLSQGNTITIIEQPEIHLHPKMQADLADLFIDIVQSNKGQTKKLLIETHSEYILKRIRRRISEGIISSEDVGIFVIDKNGDSSEIRELKIEAKGKFDYPKDFIDGEIFKDTIVFLQNQD